MSKELKRLERLGKNKAKIIDKIIADLDKTVKQGQPRLFNDVAVGALDKFDVDSEGKLLQNEKNIRLLNSLDNVFTKYANDYGVMLAQQFYDGIKQVIDLNMPYFMEIQPDKAKLLKSDKRARKIIDAWLGVDKGTPITNGYLHKIVETEDVTRKIKDFMTNSLVTQQGFFSTKEKLKTMIEGAPDKSGQLQKYYRNFVYDSISIADRAVADMYRNDLGLQFAIYAGGLIATSREFCINHNGKVYHISEIEKFNPPGDYPGYNPLLDLGKWGCRHYLNWITDGMALALRPDAIKFIKE